MAIKKGQLTDANGNILYLETSIDQVDGLQTALDAKAAESSVPDSLADLSEDSTHRTVTDTEKSTWNAKGTYSKPSGGIPSTDMTSAVQTSLGKADTALQTEIDPVFTASAAHGISSSDIANWNAKENSSNKVTSFSSPTDTQYPSAKLVNDQLALKGTYSKPSGGIPSTDLASAVQTSLGKADTAIQSVTVGTTTTGAAGSSASVTNTGTATEPVLSFTIPQGAQGIQGIQGPQGERGPQGNTGVQVDSVASIIHSIDPTATYAAADVAGADAVQDVLSEAGLLMMDSDMVMNQGMYNSNIIPSSSSTRLYSPLYDIETIHHITCDDSTHGYSINCFNTAGTYLGYVSGWISGNVSTTKETIISAYPTTAKIGMNERLSNNGSITVANSKLKVYYDTKHLTLNSSARSSYTYNKIGTCVLSPSKTSQFYVNNNNVEYNYGSNSIGTDYIPISSSNTLYATINNNTVFNKIGYVFYDSTKNIIRRDAWIDSNSKANIPNDCSYVRILFHGLSADLLNRWLNYEYLGALSYTLIESDAAIESVQKQVVELQEKYYTTLNIPELILLYNYDLFKYILDNVLWEDGHAIDASGNVQEIGGGNSYGVSDFIDVTNISALTYSIGTHSGDNKYIIATYDESKSFISGNSVSQTGSWTTMTGEWTKGSTTKYIRICTVFVERSGRYIKVKGNDADGETDSGELNSYKLAKIPKMEVQGTLRNGSVGNSGNAQAVAVLGMIDISDCKYIKLWTDRPLDENCEYHWMWGTFNVYDADAAYSEVSSNVIRRNYDEWSANVYPEDFYVEDGEIGLMVGLGEKNTSTNELVVLRTTDFTNYHIYVGKVYKDELGGGIIEDIEQRVSVLEGSSNAVLSRNLGKGISLTNACRLNRDSNGGKDFQMCIITDSHRESLSVQNAVKATNGFDTIDALIHCGDFQAATYIQSDASSFMNAMAACTKPWYVVIGNHDVGNTMRVLYGATHADCFNDYVQPIITAGNLVSGEYTSEKCWYYHDFTERNVRLIVIYEYQAPLDLADNDYWTPITYDSSLNQLAAGTTYSVGDKVNCGTFTDYSFQCKASVTPTSGQYVDDGTQPEYKVGRADRVIMQDQAQWLCSTLNSTPDGYGVIIACHNPAVINSTNQISYKFAVNTAYTAKSQGQYSMETDLLAEVVNAWINKTTLNLNVVMGASEWHGSSATYLNTLTDGQGNSYAYNLTANFSSRNSNAYFIGYVGGHAHKDLLFKADNYTGQWNVCPICGITEMANTQSSDVARPYNVDGVAYDALTVVSGKQGRLALVRIGNDKTINGEDRDFEVIDTTT